MAAKQDVVLVVDSDRAVRDALKFALEAEGFAVRLCRDGVELMAHPELCSAACLVLDDQMPLSIDVLVLDRLIERNLVVPVILLTSQATDRLRRRAGLAGVCYILEKPLLNGALVDSINDVLAMRPARL
jgi:FixJ family two-component response regulator